MCRRQSTKQRNITQESETKREEDKSQSNGGVDPTDKRPGRTPTIVRTPIQALKRAYAVLVA
jgi:hypothetical protein